MRSHLAGLLERAAVLEIGGDAGAAECVLQTCVAMPAALARRRTIAQALFR